MAWAPSEHGVHPLVRQGAYDSVRWWSKSGRVVQQGDSVEELTHHPTTNLLLRHPQDDATPGLEPNHSYIGRGVARFFFDFVAKEVGVG